MTAISIMLSSSAAWGSAVTLQWDPSLDSDVAGYKIYAGTSSGQFGAPITVGKVTQASVPNLTGGARYYFVVTAVNSAGGESVPCAELGYTLPTSNGAPVAVTDGISAIPNQTTRFDSALLARNDTDPEGEMLEVSSVSSASEKGGEGALAEGYVFYTPPAGFQGVDSLGYVVRDGHGNTASGTVVITVKPAAVPAITPSKCTPQSDGSVVVQFRTVPRRAFVIQAALDLQNWTALGQVSSGNTGEICYRDSEAGQFPQRYYRLTVP